MKEPTEKNIKTKTPSESLTILTDIVLPGETNNLHNLFGGELLARMDRACSIAARRHSGKTVVTASVSNVTFHKAVPMGSIVTLEAKVSHAFRSSMEVYVDVFVEDNNTQKTKVNEGIYIFVAVDEQGNPAEIPPIEPQTELEKERYLGAMRRKELSLIFAKKMDPHKAEALKKMFF